MVDDTRDRAGVGGGGGATAASINTIRPLQLLPTSGVVAYRRRDQHRIVIHAAVSISAGTVRHTCN